MKEKVRSLFTVSQFVERHPFITNSGMRYQIFREKTNGLEKSGAILRLGRRVLIDEEKYFAWIDSQQGRDGKAGRG